eukprot:SAG31_NODE_3135_length_4636_cov_7.918448_7_plen_58_part_00
MLLAAPHVRARTKNLVPPLNKYCPIERRGAYHFVHTPISVFWFLNLLVFRAYGSVWR